MHPGGETRDWSEASITLGGTGGVVLVKLAFENGEQARDAVIQPDIENELKKMIQITNVTLCIVNHCNKRHTLYRQSL